MNLESLEEALVDLLGDGFSIEEDDQGQLIIHTGLRQGEEEDDELIEFISDEDTEEDLDIDPDQESLDALEEEDEE
jgi:hypothetical protein